MAITMYLIFVNLHVGLIGPTKSSPHFINGYFNKVVISLAKFCVDKPQTLWKPHMKHK